MRQGVFNRLDLVARNLSPVGISLLLVVFGMIPLQIPSFSPVIPALALIAVFYWTVHRPDLMPVWAVFLIGVVQDLLGGGPMGVGTAALLLVCAIVASQRRVFASVSFFLMWCLFALVAAAALAAMWLLVCLLQGQIIDPDAVTFQYLTTIGAYPCLAWLFAQAQRAFLR